MPDQQTSNTPMSDGHADKETEVPKFVDKGVQSTPIQPKEKRKPPPVPGRRIVELDNLAVELEDGCVACRTPLKLINIVQERHEGVISGLYIR